jgi:adenine-specific DNA methylase
MFEALTMYQWGTNVQYKSQTTCEILIQKGKYAVLQIPFQQYENKQTNTNKHYNELLCTVKKE